ncbi:MAG: class I SAM-dependent methyltransferase [Gemmatimonadaceae bacterium]
MYDALVAHHLLVAHEEVPLETALAPGAYRVLRPDRIPVVTLPYEWCFSQLRAAALLTLDVQAMALAHGMILKDASGFNILFRGSSPVFIDTLSFARLEKGQPWLAYRQFCQHFLAPLAIQAFVDVRLRELQRSYLDGVPLDLASRLLPPATWLHPWALIHIHLHARAVARFAPTHKGTSPKNRKVSQSGLEGLTAHLRSAVNGIDWKPETTEWSTYEDSHAYSAAAHNSKRLTVERILRGAAPTRVLDLGANTGEYSRLARSIGAEVIAVDGDPAAVEKMFKRCVRERESGITTLCLDLANPSAEKGWAHEEWPSFSTRARADVVLALALVHHLAIGNNVPLPEIASYLARLGQRVVIEWVPKQDSQVQRLLSSRKDIFSSYTEERFVAAMKECFVIESRTEIDSSGRVIYSLLKKNVTR